MSMTDHSHGLSAHSGWKGRCACCAVRPVLRGDGIQVIDKALINYLLSTVSLWPVILRLSKYMISKYTNAVAL